MSVKDKQKSIKKNCINPLACTDICHPRAGYDSFDRYKKKTMTPQALFCTKKYAKFG
jgi:hypothetical protein